MIGEKTVIGDRNIKMAERSDFLPKKYNIKYTISKVGDSVIAHCGIATRDGNLGS